MINTHHRGGGQDAIGDDRITAGANNTTNRRLTAPDISGFLVSTAFAGGSREYKTREGNTCWPTGCGFVSHPTLPHNTADVTTENTALTKRSNQEGGNAVGETTAPIYDTFPRGGGQDAIGDDRITAGANNTNTKRLTAPDISGFLVSTAFAGGSREYKTREGNTCWPTSYGFVSHPTLPHNTADVTTENTALTKRHTKIGGRAVGETTAPIYDTFPRGGGQDAIGDDRITAGARNTHFQRLTAPDRGGFVANPALQPGVRQEYNTGNGNTGWPTGCGFSSSRCQTTHGSEHHPLTEHSALETRSNQEGASAVYNLISGFRDSVAAVSIVAMLPVMFLFFMTVTPFRDLTRQSGGDR